MDTAKKGTLRREDLEAMTHSQLKGVPVDWGRIIAECDQSGDGSIDFQEFISACINRKRLRDAEEVKKAFRILDND